MIEPPTEPTRWPRLERLIERMDRPLLVLAVVAMLLYLLELHGHSSGWHSAAIDALSGLIDTVFAIDLCLKLLVHGRAYVATPWFLLDLLSSLPVLDTLANGVLGLPSVRFFRGFRILRVFRGLRVMRALRRIPAFDEFEHEASVKPEERRTQRLMSLGMLALTAGMLITVVTVRRALERDQIRRIDEALAGEVSPAQLADLGGGLVRPDVPDVHERRANVNHRERVVYFDLGRVDRLVDQYEFFLTLGMLFAMVMFMYIMAYHHMNVTQSQLRSLLNLALPRQVADRFLADPLAYALKSRAPATVVFMDFVGFTQTCEVLAHDPDLLSNHLEAAMDRVAAEVARYDLIVDKYIGDAVMCFRGGPLVTGTPEALSSIAALSELNDPYFHKVKIGGASSRDCLIGAFGTSGRLSYTILGDGVNLAARLEPASAQCRTQNLFDEATYRLCEGDTGIEWRRWGQIRVEGKTGPVLVYEAFDPERLGDPTFLTTFHRGLLAFEENEFEDARDLFLQASSQRPGGDEPSLAYAHRCESLLLRGLPAGWEPVFDTHK